MRKLTISFVLVCLSVTEAQQEVYMYFMTDEAFEEHAGHDVVQAGYVTQGAKSAGPCVC